MRRALTLFLGALGLAAPAAAGAAGEPTMPLAQVHAGMHCTARSVLQGTTISTFGADVMDLVDGAKAGEDTRILMKFSGPAIADTGIGPGFSGSPVSCPDAHGVQRVIGAISEGIGDYGNDVGLVTPIGQMLGQKVTPPIGVQTRRALLARARPLGALTYSGFSAPVRHALLVAANHVGASVYAVPGGPASGRFPPQALVPGASLSVGLADGDFSTGAIGTVTYRDGTKLWGFGHPMDDAGRRALFLQDAYVYTVVGNPLGTADVSSYKLAAPGHDLGTLSGDGPNAVAGTVGALPPSTLFTARVHDLDTGKVLTAASRIADETDVGQPFGDSTLDLVAAGGTASLVTNAYGGAPAAETGRMCATIRIREIARPTSFCDRYVGTGVAAAGLPSVLAGSAATDLGTATALIDGPQLQPLHVTSVHVDFNIARGLRQAFIRSVAAPRRAARGSRIRVTLTVRRPSGRLERKHFRVRIPKSLKPGVRRLVLVGPADDSGSLAAALSTILGGTDTTVLDSGTSDFGAAPKTRKGLVAAIRSLGRYDGVTALFGRAHTGAHVFRDAAERISGAASVKIRIR